MNTRTHPTVSLVRKFKIRLFTALLIGFLVLPALPSPVPAVADSTVLAGSGWLSGGGVDVMSGGDGSSMCVSKPGNPAASPCPVNTSYTGEKWQCVELVSRLYITKGWIASRWQGNGNTLKDYIPSGLAKQDNGSVSYVNSGDVITYNNINNSAGHAAIIDSFSGSTANVINQNATLNSTATISSGSLSNSNASFNASWAGFTVQAIIHAPVGGAPSNYDDFVIYRPDGGTGYWYAKSGPGGTSTIPWVNGVMHGGWSQDIPVTGKFNTDGYDDLGIYRLVSGTGYWYVIDGVNTGNVIENGLAHGGWSQDIPVAGNFDSSSKDDYGIYRYDSSTSTGYWYFKSSSTGYPSTPIWGATHGSAGDKPVVGDVNGDGIDDFGIYRVVNGTAYWYFKSGSNGQQISAAWGVTHGGWSQDVPVSGDFNNDGIDDYGIYRPVSGTGYWYVKSASNGQQISAAWGVTHGGWSQDVPLMGNYD